MSDYVVTFRGRNQWDAKIILSHVVEAQSENEARANFETTFKDIMEEFRFATHTTIKPEE